VQLLASGTICHELPWIAKQSKIQNSKIELPLYLVVFHIDFQRA